MQSLQNICIYQLKVEKPQNSKPNLKGEKYKKRSQKERIHKIKSRCEMLNLVSFLFLLRESYHVKLLKILKKK